MFRKVGVQVSDPDPDPDPDPIPEPIHEQKPEIPRGTDTDGSHYPKSHMSMTVQQSHLTRHSISALSVHDRFNTFQT